jgi:putative endonuclease
MFFVYMLASQKNGTLYIGQTDDLSARICEHKEKVFKGFSARYNCTRLVWFETHETRVSAFTRERQIKKWNRAWKIRRIETNNPDWGDLLEGLTEQSVYHPSHHYDPQKL